MAGKLLKFTEKGIFCEQGDFYIDPVRPVKKAIITHAHSDHARRGHRYYLAEATNRQILKLRLGSDLNLQLLPYSKTETINGVKVSFHPAGHIWGSSQVKVEYKGEIWVVSGDYKLENDLFSGQFEPVACQHFVTESTFALPVFQWRPQQQIISEIEAWWTHNASAGKTSILTAYALGKAQRLLANLDLSIGRIFVHGSIINVNEALKEDGAEIAVVTQASPGIDKSEYIGSLIITPGSSVGPPWINKLEPYELASVSGWMQIRGIKQRRNAGHGFVMSDHADWKDLTIAVQQTGASSIYVTHGYTDVYAKWLREQGYNAVTVSSLSGQGELEE